MRQPNFARLNHVLIPSTKDRRDRLRSGWIGKLFWPIAATFGALTEEGRTFSLLMVLVGGFAIDVHNTELYVLWAILAGALAASILARVFYALERGVSAEVLAPRCVLVGEELVFGITIHNEGLHDLGAVRVSGPFLPWDGRWAASSPGVARLRRGESARVELRARFVARGEHHLDPFGVAALVPFGLTKGRSLETSGTRFLVLPRIARVVRLSIPESRSDEKNGATLASRTGESMELLGVRPYRPGDPIRLLHARSWARTGLPIVREYQEELFRRVGVLVDVDASDEGRAEAAISLGAGVVSHLARGASIVDLFVAGEQVQELTFGRNLGFLEQALEVLACLVPSAARTGDPAPLLAQIEPHLARLSTLIVVDAGTRATAVVERARSAGIGCLWLRVDRRAGRRVVEGALAVDVGAIERGEGLLL
jgi:uncharacterized protein (DUF58 family)